MANKIHNEEMKRWCRGDLNNILVELQDGKQVYTHHFEHTFSDGRRHYNFVGKSNRPHLRKCLWTLEADGLIENIDLGMNIHQWKITERGKEFLKTFV